MRLAVTRLAGIVKTIISYSDLHHFVAPSLFSANKQLHDLGNSVPASFCSGNKTKTYPNIIFGKPRDSITPSPPHLLYPWLANPPLFPRFAWIHILTYRSN